MSSVCGAAFISACLLQTKRAKGGENEKEKKKTFAWLLLFVANLKSDFSLIERSSPIVPTGNSKDYVEIEERAGIS